jgi:FSR family fosmidomycin resistance protein-like MFS transporter
MNTISTIDSDNAVLAQKTLFFGFVFIAAHLINDLMQSVIPAAYPILKKTLV